MNEILKASSDIIRECFNYEQDNDFQSVYAHLKEEMKKPGADSKTLGFCLMALDSSRLANDIVKIYEQRNKLLKIIHKLIMLYA
mgnify:CR=1 FL=1